MICVRQLEDIPKYEYIFVELLFVLVVIAAECVYD